MELISVVIPVRNGERYVAAAIESVYEQRYPKIELIVVDDGSTDGTAAEVAKFGERIIYLKGASQGAAVARNTGIKRARGELLAFLDADDLWVHDKLELQVKELEQTKNNAVFGWVQHFISPDVRESVEGVLACPEEKEVGFLPGCMLCHRSSFEAVGEFASELRAGEFIEWFVRAREQGFSYSVVPSVVLKRRIHGGNLTLQTEERNKNYLQIVHTMLKLKKTQSSSRS